MLAALENPDAWISSPTAKYSVKSTDQPVVNLSVDWVAEISDAVNVFVTVVPLKSPAPNPIHSAASLFPAARSVGVISAGVPDKLEKT